MLGELTGAVTLYYEISTMLKTKPGTTTQTSRLIMGVKQARKPKPCKLYDEHNTYDGINKNNKFSKY